MVPVIKPRLSHQNNKHHFPVVVNGKLLDVAVITEKNQSTKSPKVNLRQWVHVPETNSDVEVKDIPPAATPHEEELGKKD